MEILDIVDRNGEPTGETIERSEAHRSGVMHRTSHVWLIRSVDSKPQILLQKRCESKDSFPGCYDISSAGHIPAGVGFEESAVRELREELSVDASEDELIYCGDRIVEWDSHFHGAPFHDRQFSRVFILWKDMNESKFVLQPDEVESVMWIGLDDCIEKVRSNSFRHCIAEEELAMVRRAVIK